MTKDFDDLMEREMRDLPEIPFSQSLQEQIVQQAMTQRKANGRKSPKRQLWKPLLAGTGGVVAAAIVLAAVITPPHHDEQHTTANTTMVNGYELQTAKLQVTSIHIGTIPGEPANSSVIATVKNTGTQPIGKTDVVGLLAFPANTARSNLLASDSLTFVNGPERPIPPGATGQWTFHPVGAPHDSTTEGLTEQPYLVFYQTNLVKNPTLALKKPSATPQPTKAQTNSMQSLTQVVKHSSKVIWKKTSLQLTNVTAVPAKKGKTWQSIELKAILKNTGKTTVNLNQLWAVTWYSSKNNGQNQNWNWAEPGDTRFINRLHSDAGNHIAPGQQLEVYFGIVGSSQTDFLNRTPHLAILQR